MERVVLTGDCLEHLRRMPDASVHAVVTDPPYGLSQHSAADTAACLAAWLDGREYRHGKGGFMGRQWDAWVPGPEVWREALRVLKPGGHACIFAGTRTVDLMGIALRLAGFEIRDSLHWLYGTGFPKSHNISKAIDKSAGVKREAVGVNPSSRPNSKRRNAGGFDGHKGLDESAGVQMLTAPATPEAAQWEGWGTALKPAHEPIILARKPLDGTVAANVLRHGAGGLNVDECRVATAPADAVAMARCNTPGSWSKSGTRAAVGVVGGSGSGPLDTTQGRWPPNVLLIHAPGCAGDRSGVGCVEGCAVGEVGAQSGVLKARGNKSQSWGGNLQGGPTVAPGRRYLTQHHARPELQGDGTAARFFPSFYTAKASRSEREAGLDAPDGKRANRHPTVKPIKAMRWLVRLVTPPGGVVLDPFTGSGTTGCAAALEGFAFIGCEQDEGHAEIARRRIAHWAGGMAGGEVAAPVVTAAQDEAPDVLPGQLALL